MNSNKSLSQQEVLQSELLSYYILYRFRLDVYRKDLLEQTKTNHPT
jgi:hypothetical protein